MPELVVEFVRDLAYEAGMEARVAVLEHIAKTTVAALERLEQRQDVMLDRMDRRFEAMDQRLVTLNIHHRQDFLWLIAIQVATVGGLLTAIAKGFHWL